MASDLGFVEYVCDQMRDAGMIRFRQMFGEYAVYCDEKVVALICDDQLFIKPTEVGHAFLGKPLEVPPYTGAKPYFLIDSLDDREGLSQLIGLTARELPQPERKRRKSH
jgi:TfoX/Sxy family transcriptional regulator of competence genes